MKNVFKKAVELSMKNIKLKELIIGFCILANAILYFVSLFLWLSVTEELLLNSAVTVVSLSLSLILLVLKKDQFKTFYESRQFQFYGNTLTKH